MLAYACFGPLIALPFTWLHNRTGVLLLALVLHTAINNWQRVLPTASLFPVLSTALALALVIAGRMWRRLPDAAAPRAGAWAIRRGERGRRSSGPDPTAVGPHASTASEAAER